MDWGMMKRVVETLLFITDHPLGLAEIKTVLGDDLSIPEVAALVTEIRKDYETRQSPLVVREVAEGWQLSTDPALAPYVRRLFKDRITVRLSASALETLSIIAYKQPMTRAEIEEIRGVEAIAVLETLLERKLVRIVGRKETVGRPLVYGTTPEFLRYFNFKSLNELPPLAAPQPSPGTPLHGYPSGGVPLGDSPLPLRTEDPGAVLGDRKESSHA